MSAKYSNDASFKLLGLIAVEKKLITTQQLNEALRYQVQKKIHLGEILVEQGWVSRTQLKVLLDIHSLKLYSESNVKIGQLALINEFASKDQIEKTLAKQKTKAKKQPLGEMLIEQGVLTGQQRDALLVAQKRLVENKKGDNSTVNCPVCEKEYVLKDPDRFRKIRCRICRMVFEVGIRVESITLDTNFDPYEYENENEKNIDSFAVNDEKKASRSVKGKSDQKSSQFKALTEYMEAYDIKTDIELEGTNPFFKKSKAVGKYVFGEEIARGGMGAILETLDNDLRRTVVTKVLLKNDSKEAISKFIEEAQITGQLEHPNIVPVHEIGVNESGQAYFTMKKVKGQTLLSVVEKIKKGDENYLAKYPLDELIEILLKVCDSIAFAHEKGVIHCDLKPENIMVGEFGEVMTMDWGLAKVRGRSHSHEFESLEEVVSTERTDSGQAKTVHGTIAGTPEYMSPEQARGDVEEITTQSDIYSLGGVLYTIVAHRLPVDGTNVRKILMRVVEGDLNPLPNDLHPDLAAIIKKAMAVNVLDRYLSVYDLRDDLIKYLRGYSVSAKEDSFGEITMKLIKRNLLLSGVFVTAFLFLMLFTILLYKEILDKESLIAQQQETLAQLKTVSEGRSHDRRLSAPVILNEGLVLLRKGAIREAFLKMQEAEDFDPDLLEATYFKGLASLCNYDYQMAFDSLNEYDTKSVMVKDGVDRKYNVSVLLKHILSINQFGENTYDLLAIQKVVNENFQNLSRLFDAKISELVEQYDKVILPIHPETSLFTNEKGLLVVSLKGLADVKSLPDMRTFPIVSLDLRGTSIKSLENLPATHIKELFLDGCPIDNFEDLAKFRNLRFLSLAHTSFKSASLLAKLPIEDLNVSYTKMDNTEDFKNLPLVSLNIVGLPVSSLSSLKGLKLKKLYFGDADSGVLSKQTNDERVSLLEELSQDTLDDLKFGDDEEVLDLSLIKDMPLEVLHMYSTNVDSIDVLRNKSLIELDVGNTWISDISILKGMPLKVLVIPGRVINSKESIAILRDFKLDVLGIRGSLPFEFLKNNFVEQNRGKQQLLPPIFAKEFTWETTEISSLENFPFEGCENINLSKCIGLTRLDGVERLVNLRRIVLPVSLSSVPEFEKLARLKKIEKVVTAEYGELSANTFFQFIKTGK